MTKVSETKWRALVEDVRAIYAKHGSSRFADIDAHGLNEYYKSEKPTFVFYYDGLSRIKTPDGEIVPLGSRLSGDERAAMQELIQKYQLRHVSTTNKNYEQWNVYEADADVILKA